MSDRFDALRAGAAAWARDFTEAGTGLAGEPDDTRRLLELPGVTFLSTAGVPEEYGGSPLRMGDERYDVTRARDRVVVMEELARGDIGVLLAAPGPSMSGILVQHQGSPEQRAAYFSRFIDRPTWSAFALTEPDHGSDAGGITSTFTEDATSDGAIGRISGTKRYIGNATRASIATVFARRAPGPLGIGSFLVDTDQPGYRATALRTTGLRGARIGEIVLAGAVVGCDGALGAHLSPTRRGLRAARSVFDRLRPGVAALALGVSWAAFDVARSALGVPGPVMRSALDRIEGELLATRALIARAASAVDATGDGALASVAKLSACRQAERVTLELARLVGPGARVDLPRLDRAVRDARGVEYMEGTSNMQRLTIAQSLVTRGGAGL